MKQSTKLLSLVLAIIMAFSCMSVIGSAAKTLDKGTMKYDSMDDAVLYPNQVADIALDLVDELLADLDFHENIVDLGFLGKLEIDLRSVDLTFSSLWETSDGGLFKLGSAILDVGDVEKLSFDALASGGNPYQRGEDGHLQMIYQLLQFLADNAGTLKKAAYGIGTTNGLNLGIIGSFLGGSLDGINEILGDIPGLVKGLVYDMLIHGSYGYAQNSEELGGGSKVPFSTVEAMLDAAVAGLLTNPQQYDMVGEGDAAVKVWNEKSLLLPSVAAYGIDVVTDYFSISGTDVDIIKNEDTNKDGKIDANENGVVAQAHTVFELLDKAAPFAIYDLGVGALNNNLKKALMEAVEADLNEINKKDLPEDVKAAFEVDAVDADGNPVKPGEESYVTYIAYDKMVKSGEDWYYTTLENEVKIDPATNEPDLDDEGNEQTTKARKYFKINLAVANEFGALINWNWNITAPAPLSRDYSKFTYAQVASNEIDYTAMINHYGSLVESLNDVIGIVYDNALTLEVRNAFQKETGNGWVKGKTSEKINDNLTRLLKYLLGEYGHKIFGEDSAYAGLGYEYFEDMTIIDIVALIGPEFFKDVMPQLIIPQNADGSYAFAKSDANGSSAAFLQFGALVIREFMTEIAPNVNYDAYIFDAATLTNGAGRKFNSANTAEDWFNIILNMGMDIAYTYLYQITNFGDEFDYADNGKSFTKANVRTTDVPVAPANRAEAISEKRWKDNLNKVIEWGANYVGQGSTGVISAFAPNTITSKYTDPLDRLSYVLNTLLPLGFINGLEDANFDASVSVLFNRMKIFLTKMDFTQLTSLFGRNGVTANGDTSSLKNGNILDKELIPMALGLVNDILNLVFGKEFFLETSLTANLDQANLANIVEGLLTRLNAIKAPLLLNAAPVLAKFIKGWGTEQEFDTPDIALDKSVVLVDGATKDGDGKAINYEVTVSNGANGIWRSWRNADGTKGGQDEQYQIKMTGVVAKDYDGNTSSKVKIASFSQDFIPFGGSKTFEYNATGIDQPGEIVRFDVSYQVYEGETKLSDEVFTQSIFTYLNYNGSDERTPNYNSSDYLFPAILTPHYVPLSTAVEVIPTLETTSIRRESSTFGKDQTGSFTPTEATKDGITFGNLSLTLAKKEWKTKTFKNFSNESGTYKSEKPLAGSASSVNYTINGGVNRADWEAAGKKSGSTTEFTIGVYNSKQGSTQNKTLTLIYYDDQSLNSITSIANSEVSKGRVKGDYKQSGYTYVPGEMITADATVDGVEVFKETNATLVWIDENENEVAEGTAGAIKAMKFDNAQVWAKYETAFKRAVKEAYGVFISTRDFKNLDLFLKELEIAVHDIEYTKADSTSSGIDDDVAALKAALKSVENTYTKDYDYTDYRMYRLNRLNDARDEAQYLINLQNDQSNLDVTEIDESFPYTWIEEDDLRALVAYDSDLTNLKKDNVNIVTALLEKLDEEEIKGKEEWLDNKKLEYASKTALDVAMADSLLTKGYSRLLDRSYKSGKNAPNTYYLQTEITSAQKEIGLVNEWEEDNEWGEEPGTQKYSDRSWTKYINAYNNAVDVLNGTNGAVKSQKNAFDAKWELLCCRNELVLYFDEADYSQLETLMDQAKYALSNMNLYSNEAADLGKVLAELGVLDANAEGYKLAEIKNADGNAIDLFPGSAAYVNSEPYSYLEQDVINRKCDELKEALARLKFKGLNITATGDIVVDDDAILEEGNEKEGIDAVTTTIARIAAGLDADTVKTFFNVSAEGDLTVDADNITVSNDLYYTVDTDLKGLVGTNSVVTFYTVVDKDLGIKIPVATVKIVVDGDINGDGAVDAIDGAQAHLVNAKLAELEGCYLLAGDLDGSADRKIEDADYVQVINNIFGKEVKKVETAA